MSRLEELLKELCPDGVEYKTLGEIGTEMYRGAGIKRNDITEIGTPCVRYGEIYTTYHISFDKCVSHTKPEFAAKGKHFSYGDILFAITGESVEDIGKSCVYLGYEDCLAGGDIVVLKHKQNPKYLAYALETTAARRQKSKGKIKSKVVHASVPSLKEIIVPVPPLEIQSEIVKILDNFTELTAELTARKKQYEYYRDKLLTFDRKIKWGALGDVAIAIKSGNNKKRTEHGKYPVFGSTGIIGYTDNPMYMSSQILVARVGAYAGKVQLVDGSYDVSDNTLMVQIKSDYNIRYFYHLLQYLNLGKLAKGGGQPLITAGQLKKLEIPIPALEIQKKIVDVLDHFDAVCNSLHIGLPAEIEARKKQYEYYRDSLLTFMEKDSIILNRTEQNRCLIRLLQYVFGYVWIPLSDLAKNCDAERKPVKQGNRKKGQYPYYGASGIVDYVEDYLFDGEYLLISEDGANLVARSTPIAFSIHGKNWVNNHAHVLKFTDSSLQKFVEFYLNSLDLIKYISGAAQPKLNQKNLNSILIPVPDEKELKRRISVLETFDTICNDLNAGLPAEIEARKKEYEYYRDRLLNFPEKRLSK